jgi:hypothetical protein
LYPRVSALQQPSIGYAKKMLFGKFKEPMNPGKSVRRPTYKSKK